MYLFAQDDYIIDGNYEADVVEFTTQKNKKAEDDRINEIWVFVELINLLLQKKTTTDECNISCNAVMKILPVSISKPKIWL